MAPSACLYLFDDIDEVTKEALSGQDLHISASSFSRTFRSMV